MRRIACLILLILCACAPANTMGPNSMVLVATGIVRDTADAQYAMGVSAQATAQAVAAQGQAQAQVFQATAQAMQLEQQAADNRATATAQAAILIGIQATAQTIERQSTQAAQGAYLAGQATQQAVALQATATAQATGDSRDRKNMTSGVLLLGLALLILAIVIIFFAIGWQVVRVVSARADIAISVARQKTYMETSVGLLDTVTGATVAPHNGAPSEADQASLQVHREPTSLEAFVVRAANKAPNRWDDTIIPSNEKMGMGASGWMARTDELVGYGLVEKLPGVGTQVKSGNLSALYQMVRKIE